MSLVLSRKPIESVIIEGQGRMEVTVVRVAGDKVRLAFDGPQTVYRKELSDPLHEPIVTAWGKVGKE